MPKTHITETDFTHLDDRYVTRKGVITTLIALAGVILTVVSLSVKSIYDIKTETAVQKAILVRNETKINELQTNIRNIDTKVDQITILIYSIK